MRTQNADFLQKIADVSEGLENSLKKAANSCNTLDELINLVISKRYPETRIKRILLYTLLNITKKEMEASKKVSPYIRVLGFTSGGKELLSKIKKANPNIKIITSVKKFIKENNNKNLQMMIDKDIFATNVYTLGFECDSVANLDFAKKIISK